MLRLSKYCSFALIVFACNASAVDYGIYATAGTVGWGGGVAGNLNKHIGARIGYTNYTYDVDDVEEADLVYEGEVELGGLQLLLDWYPFGGGFRVSTGVIDTVNIKLTATPEEGTYTFDEQTYDASDIGSATAEADFKSMAPYIGLGFGRALSATGRFAFSMDLGVALTGAPDTHLNVTCASNDPILCASLNEDVADEKAELDEELSDLKYWPLIAFNFSYRF